MRNNATQESPLPFTVAKDLYDLVNHLKVSEMFFDYSEISSSPYDDFHDQILIKTLDRRFKKLLTFFHQLGKVTSFIYSPHADPDCEESFEDIKYRRISVLKRAYGICRASTFDQNILGKESIKKMWIKITNWATQSIQRAIGAADNFNTIITITEKYFSTLPENISPDSLPPKSAFYPFRDSPHLKKEIVNLQAYIKNQARRHIKLTSRGHTNKVIETSDISVLRQSSFKLEKLLEPVGTKGHHPFQTLANLTNQDPHQLKQKLEEKLDRLRNHEIALLIRTKDQKQLSNT